MTSVKAAMTGRLIASRPTDLVPVASLPCLRDPSKAANPEGAVILDQLLFGIMVVAVVLLLLPFLLVMAGVGAAMLLWFVISAAVLGALVLCFPVLTGSRFCCLRWSSGCSLSIDEPGTGLPEIRERRPVACVRIGTGPMQPTIPRSETPNQPYRSDP
jgi:hypothetical protein